MTSFARRTLFLLACAAVAGGCPRAPEPPDAVRVVLVTIDTLRFDRLAETADRPSAMPRLAARAREGALFTRFYAGSPVTQPSHASMFTGLQPWEHGVTRNGQVLDGRHATVAEAFREAGFETRAVVSSFPLARRFGLAEGFDVYEEAFTESFFELETWAGEHDVPDGQFFSVADTVTDAAIAQLDAARSERQLLWFHYFDPHSPYGVHVGGNVNRKQIFQWVDRGASRDDLVARVISLYDADVMFLDRSLERLFRRLDADADLFETHVFIVADHGESLGEGESLGHGNSLATEQLHVPALLLSPRVAPGERDDLAGSIDVAPTLLTLAGITGWQGGGRDLASPGPTPSRVYGMRNTSRSPPARERRLDGHHEIEDLEFFAAAADGRIYRGNAKAVTPDPGGASPPVAQVFADFERSLAGLADTGDLDPEVERALRALGYVD